jgi:WD40 repeat protein
MALSADGGLVASGSFDQTVRLWDAGSGACLAVLPGHQSPVASVALTADAARLASGSGDGSIRLWDTASGKCLATLQEPSWNSVKCLAYSSDGTRLAGGMDDGSVVLWDTVRGKCLTTLRRHEGAVVSVAFFDDCTRLVSGASDGTVRLWDTATGSCLLSFWASDNKELAGLALWRPPRDDDPDDLGELIRAEGDVWRVLARQARAPDGRLERLPLEY